MARNRRRSSKKSKKAKAGWLGRIIRWMLLLVVIAGVLGVGGVAGIFWYHGRDLPELLDRSDYHPKQLSRVYAADGELIGEFVATDGRRTVKPMEELPDHVRYAFMAAEDADFMKHEGIDPWGMARAFYYAVRYDAGLKGTSTITQQVVKNLILTPERKLERKIKEIILARELEKNLTKEDILFLYLNTIYLGHGNYGVEEASRFYFGKSASDLEIQEAALLAGLTQSPERLTPVRHPDRALKRRKYVLRQLWEKGFIEEATYRAADKTEIELVDPDEAYPHLGSAPYFVDYVRRVLSEKYGSEKLYTGGLTIHTTLDLDRQREAQAALRRGLRTYDDRRGYYERVRKLDAGDVEAFLAKQAKEIAKDGLSKGQWYEAVVTRVDAAEDLLEVRLGDRTARVVLEPRSRILGEGPDAQELDEKFEEHQVVQVVPLETDSDGPLPVKFRDGPEAGIVSIDPATRDVVAMVGGYDFELNEYNHVTQARRQTGSTFKPFVYGAAIEEKIITPATIYLDSPTVFQLDRGKKWSPKNSDGSWRGPIRIREGLGASRNVVAVRVLKDVGIEAAQAFAKRLGIHSPMVDNYTMVMGSSELTPLEITNAYATLASGGVWAEPRFITRVETAAGETDTFQNQPERVLAPEVAFLITDLMTSVTMGYVDSEGTRRGGTAASLNTLERPIAGKTGTTNESRDAWFIGFTPQLVAGAWVGFDNNEPLGRKEYGGKVAGPIWRDYMAAAHEGKEVVEFTAPSAGITTAVIDPATGKLAREGGIEEVFLVGTAPTDYAPQNAGGGEDDFLLQQFGAAPDDAESTDETAAPN